MPRILVNSRGEIENEFGGILVWAPEAGRVIEILNANGFGAKTLPSGCSVLISKAVFDSLVSEEVATSTGPAGAQCEAAHEPEKHILKSQRQKNAILEALHSLGYEPKELPPFNDSGKDWVKAEAWEQLKSQTRMFPSKKGTFDKAWTALKREKEIIESEK
jgi:hypothetical protein